MRILHNNANATYKITINYYIYKTVEYFLIL